jgi:hypothetical protein
LEQPDISQLVELIHYVSSDQHFEGDRRQACFVAEIATNSTNARTIEIEFGANDVVLVESYMNLFSESGADSDTERS